MFSSDITINITDDFQAVFPPGNLDTAISVITPTGEIFEAIELFGFDQPDGSLGIGYSFRNPSGIDFRESDNGTYRILLNAATIPDAAGNFANGGVIGSFVVNVSDGEQTDFTPPTATLVDNGPITSISDDVAMFFVRFEDETKIGPINNDAFTITGPNGYSEGAIAVSGRGFGDTIRTRGYQIPTNGNFWGVEDNGFYTVIVNPESVFDDALNSMLETELGTFELRLG